MDDEARNFRMLICIGGGPEAYASLRFAARMTSHSCADVALLYVRPLDSGLKSGGMEVRVARENVLDWGLELPGMRHLRAARDILVELGQIRQGGGAPWAYHEISGDDAGEYVRDYRNPCGGLISLRLRTASDVTTAVVDEAKAFGADVIIVGGSERLASGLRRWFSGRPLSLGIAAHAHCSVIVARGMESGHGHLVCVEDSESSRRALPGAIRCAAACGCEVTLLSVAEDESDLEGARRAVAEAAEAFRKAGIEPREELVETGDPVEVIVRAGAKHSVIALGESEKPWFAKGFSVSHEVAAQASSSVMILR